MTAGFFPSPDNQPIQAEAPAKQDNSISSTPAKQDNPKASITKSSLPETKVEAFAWFCLQHPNFLKFVFQCILTGVVLGFCIIQLTNGGRDGSGKNDAVYWGGITSILAWWMPSPGSGTPQNQANITGGNLTIASSGSSKNSQPDSNDESKEGR